MTNTPPRVLHLSPPVGNSTVQCKAIARERAAIAPWSKIVPHIEEILASEMPAGSRFLGILGGTASFVAPDGGVAQFDLRARLGLKGDSAATSGGSNLH